MPTMSTQSVGTVDAEHLLRRVQGLLHDPDDVDLLQHRMEVAAVGAKRRGDHRTRVRAVQVEDIVAPIGGEKGAVRIEEAVGRPLRDQVERECRGNREEN